MNEKLNALVKRWRIQRGACSDYFSDYYNGHDDASNSRADELEAALAAEAETIIRNINIGNGHAEMTMEFAQGILLPIVDACKSMTTRAENYAECNVISGDESFTLTITKKFGKTPHELRQVAEKRVVELEARIQAMPKPAAADAQVVSEEMADKALAAIDEVPGGGICEYAEGTRKRTFDATQTKQITERLL